MKLFRPFLALSGAGLLATALSSCLAEPNYSSTPDISYDGNLLQRLSDGQGVRDTLALTIRYQDGDGDLGLSSDEVKDTAQARNKYTRRYAYNYFVVPYVKDGTGKFVPLASTSRGQALFINPRSYFSRFDHITTTSQPIKGTLVWSYAFLPGRPFNPGEQVQFQITIADRALHESNTIMTDPITFPTK